MNRTIAILAAAAISANAAYADNAQLSASVGVPNGSLSTVELIQLRNAMEQDNQDGAAYRIKQLKSKAGVVATRARR